jgi:hypothetical protein
MGGVGIRHFLFKQNCERYRVKQAIFGYHE